MVESAIGLIRSPGNPGRFNRWVSLKPGLSGIP